MIVPCRVWKWMMLEYFCEGSLKKDDVVRLPCRVWKLMMLGCFDEGSLKEDYIGMLPWKKFKKGIYWDASVKEVWRRMILGCFHDGIMKKDDLEILLWRKFKRIILECSPLRKLEEGWCWDASVKEVWKSMILGCFHDGSMKEDINQDSLKSIMYRCFHEKILKRMLLECSSLGKLEKEDVRMLLWRKFEGG